MHIENERSKKVHGIYEGCIKKDCFLFTDPEEGNMR